MIENLLEIISVFLLIYLSIFLFIKIRILKAFKRKIHAYFLCDNIILAFSKNKSFIFEEKNKIVADGYYLNVSGIVCRIPKVCKRFEGYGKIKVIIEKDCINFTKVS